MLKIAGVIGCGNMGNKHILCLMQIPTIVKICVYDSNSEQVNKYLSVNNIIIYNDVLKLIKDSDIIIVATPTDTHVYYLKLVSQYGKPVLVEKPVCCNLFELKIIRETFAATNMAIQINHIEEYRRAFHFLKNYLTDIKEINIVRQTSGVCKTKEDSVIIDLLPHDLGLVFALVNSKDFTIIKSCCGKSENGIINEINITILFDSSIKCTINEKKECDTFERSLIVKTSNEIIELNFITNNVIIKQNDYQIYFRSFSDNPLLSMIKDFINCIVYQTIPLVDLLKATDIVEKCLIVNKVTDGE